MNKSIKKVLLVCSLLFLSNPIPINAENDTELIFDSKQGTFQDFLNAQTGDVKVTLNSGISGAEISIPENITSLEIDLNGYSIPNIFANGIPLTISNGQTGIIYGGAKNTDITADPYISLINVRLRGNVYGGGFADSNNHAEVKGTANITLINVIAVGEFNNPDSRDDPHEVYGGGKALSRGVTKVENTVINISNSTLDSVFGGGYANEGISNVSNNTLLNIDNSSAYGDMVGCGYPYATDSTTTCGSTKLNIDKMKFPVANGISGVRSGLIIGGSLSYNDDDTNSIGAVYNNVEINISDTEIYDVIFAGGLTYGMGDFSIGSADIRINNVKAFYDRRVDKIVCNKLLYLGTKQSNKYQGGLNVNGDVNLSIYDSDLTNIIAPKEFINGSTTIEFQTGGQITGLEGIDTIILDKPIEITDYIHDPTPIQVELKGKWENDVKAITLGGKADDSLFTGTNLVYGEDTVSYWITNGIEDIPEPQPEPDPKPDHSSSSNNSSSSTIIKGDTETSVKVDNINSTLNEKTVKKLAEDNQNVPVIVESKDVKITYPTGTLTNMDKAISVKVDIDGKAAVTKKATEAAGDSKSMTLNFTEESMFSESQPIKIEVKAKPELKGKQLYYKKYDEVTNQLLLVQPTVVKEDGWLEVSQTEAGCYVVTDSIDPYWQKSITGDWYYFNTQGSVVTGWLADKDEWYYLKEDGKMQVGWISADNTWYCTNNDGKLITGWNPQGSDWYYHNGSGSLVKNEWVWDAGWYYINDEGKMLRDSYTPDGYHVNSSGVYDY